MNATLSFHRKLQLLIGLSGLAIVGTFLLAPPIPQDPAYHLFADRNTHFGIPNFWNVATNLPFLVVGLAGLRELHRGTPAILPEFRMGYRVFFAGIALVGPGSAYYHLAPDNLTLVWDRLPMTLAFMALLAIVIAEYIAVPAGRAFLWPLLFVGIVSVFYWHLTEVQGHGDLRLYGLVQFLSLLVIPLILLLFRSRFGGAAYLWAALAAYGLAKVAELLDEPLFQLMAPLSGHALKHLLAALGAYAFLLAIRRRSVESG